MLGKVSSKKSAETKCNNHSHEFGLNLPVSLMPLIPVIFTVPDIESTIIFSAESG